jgi:hypothetical protein
MEFDVALALLVLLPHLSLHGQTCLTFVPRPNAIVSRHPVLHGPLWLPLT